MSYYMADRKHRKAFLEARQSLEVKMNLEEQSQQQVRLLGSELVLPVVGGGGGGIQCAAPWAVGRGVHPPGQVLAASRPLRGPSPGRAPPDFRELLLLESHSRISSVLGLSLPLSLFRLFFFFVLIFKTF